VFVPRRPETGWSDPSTLVLAIDGSELSRDVVAVACRMSGEMEIRATVVRCIDVGAEFSPDRLKEIETRTRAAVTENWCSALEESGHSFEVDVRNAEARQGIAAAAEEVGAGLVVVGLHGAGEFRGIGGTTSYLARHLTMPLAVVPPMSSAEHEV